MKSEDNSTYRGPQFANHFGFPPWGKPKVGGWGTSCSSEKTWYLIFLTFNIYSGASLPNLGLPSLFKMKDSLREYFSYFPPRVFTCFSFPGEIDEGSKEVVVVGTFEDQVRTCEEEGKDSRLRQCLTSCVNFDTWSKFDYIIWVEDKLWYVFRGDVYWGYKWNVFHTILSTLLLCYCLSD